MSNFFTLGGLLFDIVGAVFLVYGEIRSRAAFIHNRSTGEGPNLFESQIKLLTWWRRWPFRIAKRFGPKNPHAMEESEYRSFPLSVWGITFLVIGFLGQFIGSLLTR